MYCWISFAPGYELVYGIDNVIDYAIGHINDKVKILSLNWLIRYAIDIVFGYAVRYALTVPFAMPMVIPLAIPLTWKQNFAVKMRSRV